MRNYYIFLRQVELGKSDYNALPSKFFPNDVEEEYTWEDYDREMSNKYPVKKRQYTGVIRSFSVHNGY